MDAIVRGGAPSARSGTRPGSGRVPRDWEIRADLGRPAATYGIPEQAGVCGRDVEHCAWPADHVIDGADGSQSRHPWIAQRSIRLGPRLSLSTSARTWYAGSALSQRSLMNADRTDFVDVGRGLNDGRSAPALRCSRAMRQVSAHPERSRAIPSGVNQSSPQIQSNQPVVHERLSSRMDTCSVTVWM